MRDEDDRPNGPLSEVIVQDEEIWSSIFKNRSFHFGIRGIQNFISERSRLALQLKWGPTKWAKIVERSGVAGNQLKLRRFAGWAKEVKCSPGFRANTGPLRRTLVALESFRGEMQHADIKARPLWRRKCYLKSRDSHARRIPTLVVVNS